MFPSHKSLLVALAVLALSTSPLASVGAQTAPVRRYELIDLGTLGGESSSASAIDDLGTASGWSLTAAGARRAFRWRNDSGMQDLGTLQNGTSSAAMRLSGNGEWLVGISGIRPLENPEQFRDITQGFVWAADAMQTVGALYNPADFNRRFGTSEARGVNNQGQVVGFSNVLRQNLQSAFLWENGTMTDIGHANDTAANTRAFDINDGGQVVGDIVQSGEGSARQAVFWQDGELEPLPAPDSGTDSTAVAINERGDIAGWAAEGAVSTAVLWSSGGAAQDLGTLPGDESSQALGINDRAQVVGWSGNSDQTRAFSWEAGVMTDLNTVLPPGSGWVLLEASDINSEGTIVGTGLLDGQRRAYLLRPRSDSGGGDGNGNGDGQQALSCLRPASP